MVWWTHRENSFLSFFCSLNLFSFLKYRNWKGHKWAEPSLTALKQIMRYTYGTPEEVVSKGQKSREFILNSFSLTHMGETLVREIQRIKRDILPTDPTSLVDSEL
jgi:hypothetical protein